MNPSSRYARDDEPPLEDGGPIAGNGPEIVGAGPGMAGSGPDTVDTGAEIAGSGPVPGDADQPGVDGSAAQDPVLRWPMPAGST